MDATALPSASTTEKWVVSVCSRAGWTAGGGPRSGVGRRGHLLDRHGDEVGVAEIVGAVHVGAAEGFDDEVNLLGRAIAGVRHVVDGYVLVHVSAEHVGYAVTRVREVVAGEDIEDLQQHDAASGGRRRGDDVVVAIGSGERRAVLDFIGGKIG